MDLENFLKENNYQNIELQDNSSGHFELCLKINGEDANFILDTGASNTCIALSSIDKFNLEFESSDLKAAGAGAINIDTYKSRINQIKIGEIVIENEEIIIFDLSDINKALELESSNQIDGILGGDFLNERSAIISYKDKKLFLKKSI